MNLQSAVLCVIGLSVVILAYIVVAKLYKKLTVAVLKREAILAIHREKNDMYEQWIRLMHAGRGIANYLQSRGYSHVALYGLGETGKLVIQELDGAGIPIDYILDPDSTFNHYNGHEIKKNDSGLKPTDVMIITEFSNRDDVADELESTLDCPVLALDDLLFSLDDI